MPLSDCLIGLGQRRVCVWWCSCSSHFQTCVCRQIGHQPPRSPPTAWKTTSHTSSPTRNTQQRDRHRMCACPSCAPSLHQVRLARPSCRASVPQALLAHQHLGPLTASATIHALDRTNQGQASSTRPAQLPRQTPSFGSKYIQVIHVGNLTKARTAAIDRRGCWRQAQVSYAPCTR